MENHRFLIFVSHQLMYESRWKNMTKMTMGIGYSLRQDCRDILEFANGTSEL